MAYRNKDFKKYYCDKLQRHIWVLGYFGGGSINFAKFEEAAKDFAKETGLPVSDVFIDEVLSSRRFKGFKYIYAIQYNKKKVEQKPLEDSEVLDDVFEWLND